MGQFLKATETPGTSLREREPVILPLGRLHREGEPSMQVTGRVLHEAATGTEPGPQETKVLSEVVHWTFGAGMGALYGAIRGSAGVPDAMGGIAFGSAVWLLFSEIAVPLLGLAPPPTRTPLKGHLGHLGGHWVYGLITAATLQTLRKTLGSGEQPALAEVVDEMDRALEREAVAEM